MSKSPLKKYFEKSAFKYDGRRPVDRDETEIDRYVFQEGDTDAARHLEQWAKNNPEKAKNIKRGDLTRPTPSTEYVDDGTDYDPDVYDPSLHEDD